MVAEWLQPPIFECTNRPFPSSLVPLFQSESKCETILMKMTDLHENGTACRTHFHMKGFALRLVLKQRHKRTRKWPIKKSMTPTNPPPLINDTPQQRNNEVV